MGLTAYSGALSVILRGSIRFIIITLFGGGGSPAIHCSSCNFIGIYYYKHFLITARNWWIKSLDMYRRSEVSQKFRSNV